MEFTEEQKRFYESFENLSPDVQEAMLCEAREVTKHFLLTIESGNGK